MTQELTLEQKRALALARARQRVAEKSDRLPAQSGGAWWEKAPLSDSGEKKWWEAAPLVEPTLHGTPAGYQQTAEPTDALSRTRVVSGGMLEGIPVVGPLIRGGVDRAAAATLAPFSDKTYGEILEMIQRETGREKETNPWLDTGSQVAGAVVGTIPMVMATPGAFGAGGGSLATRSLASATSGAALGGADAAMRSTVAGEEGQEVLSDAAQGAAIGLGVGAIAPAAGELIGRGLRAVLPKSPDAAGLGRAPARQIERALASDGVAPSQIGSRLSGLGDNAMIADLGPNLQRQAGAIAATPGRGQEIVRSAIAARDAGANARISGGVDDILGRASAPSQIDAGIRSSQKALSPLYQEALKGARRVDTRALADSLDGAAVNLRGEPQQAAISVRKMLNIAGTDYLDPNPATLLATRQAIDDMIEGATGNTARILGEARSFVDDILAEAVPGIKQVDARFSELARQRDALQRGQSFLDSGRNAPRPAELAAEVAEGALPRGQIIGPSGVPIRLRDGARAEIDRIIGTNANDRVALQRILKGEGSWNRDRLATLFGQDKADRLLRLVDAERTFAETSNIVSRNSETAARQAAMKEIAGENGAGFGVREGYMAGGSLGAARSAGIKTAERAADLLRSLRANNTNAELADALTTTTGRDRIVRALMALEARRPTAAELKLIQALITSQGTRGNELVTGDRSGR